MKTILAIALATAVASPAVAGSKTVIFNLTGGATDTFVHAINAQGTVTGGYVREDGIRLTYLRHPDGSIETFGLDGADDSWPLAINKSGQVAGSTYNYTTFQQHGYLRQPGGTLVQIDFPGADTTAAGSINASGAIVGNYRTGDTYGMFLRDPDGTFHDLKVPKWPAASAIAIADNGAIVGWVNKRNHYRGFYRDPEGSFSIFDPPNVKNATWPMAIAADGTVAGYYGARSGRGYGFVRHPDGRIDIFLPDGALSTVVYAINDRGVAVGDYYGTDHKYHSFVRKADGTIKPFSLKRRSGDKVSAGPTAINNAGAIAGVFSRSKDGEQSPIASGFVKQP